MTFIASWRDLRQRLREAPARARALDEKITAALYRYRIHLTKLSTKPHRLDRQIWDTYDSILAEIRRLRAISNDRIMRSSSTLRELCEQWQEVFDRQDRLVSLIDETIERSNFYNKMETAKEDHSRQREKDAQLQSRLSGARRSLIQALHYVLLREKSGEGVTSGSMVLDLDLAIDSWERGVSEILALQGQGSLSPDQEVQVLEALRERIVEAPRWAERLKKLEGDFDTLLGLEAQLRNMAGSGQLSALEVSEMVDLLRVDARDYWANSDWQALEEVIDSVQAYVDRESRPLQSQLYVVRKRKGHTPLAKLSEPQSSENRKAKYIDPELNDTVVRTDSTTDAGNGLYKGSLERAIVDQERNSQDKKTYVDPDADESVRSAFGGRKRDHGLNE